MSSGQSITRMDSSLIAKVHETSFTAWRMHAGEGKHHHHKKDTDDTYGGGDGGDQSGGYGGGNTGDQVLPPSLSVVYACRCQVSPQRLCMQDQCCG